MSKAHISPQELGMLAEIQWLLDEAYDHYFKYGDGTCKSAEGYVSLGFGNYFERRDGGAKMRVEIYSYIYGNGRHHYFDNVALALSEVKRWHKAEMEYDYSKDGWFYDEEID